MYDQRAVSELTSWETATTCISVRLICWIEPLRQREVGPLRNNLASSHIYDIGLNLKSHTSTDCWMSGFRSGE